MGISVKLITVRLMEMATMMKLIIGKVSTGVSAAKVVFGQR